MHLWPYIAYMIVPHKKGYPFLYMLKEQSSLLVNKAR